ncbi:MAG: SufD family Fe-S cluster assembly protein [Parolsenella sp.]|uniref:SufB/SufD family protein n=1 Tax=Parolsenella sp. TaxID=2083006 RepID=UPI002E79BAC1|nr:SufD family Fe-S cluster assembly protein [Parolsenella sp.]MEE1372097.1 SufD family Fe-S cluster assembly protein [Parolsenella sp.]
MAHTLTGAGLTPAQTWNWLKTNDTTLVVPEPPAADPMAEVPAAARRITCGAGAEATQWLDASATARRTIVVPADTTGEHISVKVDTSLGSVAQTSVFVRPGAEAFVDVVVADGLGAAPKARDERAHAEDNEAAAREGDAPVEHGDAPVTSGHALRIHAEQGSHVHVTLLVAATAGEQYLDSLGIIADDRAEVTVRQYVIGTATTALGSAIDLAGDHSRLDLSLRYLVGAGEKLDLAYTVPVRGVKARANLDMTGVLSDDAKKALRATIDLVNGCKGAKASEQETVLVCGDDVVNKTLPTILCDEDDVEGSHGAAIGTVSPEQLAYLSDRGLTEDEAEGLFRRAIVDDAAITLPGDAPAAVISWAERTLGAETAAEIRDMIEEA